MAGRAPSSPRDAVPWSGPFRVRTRSTLWIGTAVFVLGLAATGARVIATQRLYRAEALVIYEPDVLPSEADAPREAGPHLAEMLTARPRLEALIEEMRLYPALVGRRGLGAGADEMRDDIRVAARDGTSFAVSYDAADPEQAKAVLSRLVNGVVDGDTERRQQQAEAARQALDLERQKAEADLAVKQARLSDFSAKHPAAKSTPATNDRDRGADSAAEATSLELRAAELESMLAHPAAREAAPALDPAVVAGATHRADPAVVAARAKIAEQLLADERDLDEKQTRLPGQHPEIKAALRRVSDARAALRKADAAVAASAAAAATPGGVRQTGRRRADSLAAAGALAAVRARIAALRAPHRPSPAASPAGPGHRPVRRRRRDGRRTVPRSLGGARAPPPGRGPVVPGAAALDAGRGGTGRRLPGFGAALLDRSRPIPGRRLKVGLVGGSLSLLLGLFAFLLAGRLDGRLHDPIDIARILGPKVVVVVPKLGIKLAGRQAAARGSGAGG